MILRLRQVSLRLKIFLSTVGVVLLVSASIAMLARWILVDSLNRELELRGIAVGQSIAERASGFILDNVTRGRRELRHLFYLRNPGPPIDRRKERREPKTP